MSKIQTDISLQVVERGHVRGAANASLTILVYGEFMHDGLLEANAVHATPSIFIDGEFYFGAYDVESGREFLAAKVGGG
jgi:hypothetical protein